MDYNSFKLFLLSVLWRLHIAKDNAISVNLSETDACTIRNCILSGIAPNSLDFPVFGLCLIDPLYNNTICDEIVTFGRRYSNNEMTGEANIYVVIFGGIAWHYIVPSIAKNSPIYDLILDNAKDFKLPTQNIRTFKPILHIYGSIEMAASFSK